MLSPFSLSLEVPLWLMSYGYEDTCTLMNLISKCISSSLEEERKPNLNLNPRAIIRQPDFPFAFQQAHILRTTVKQCRSLNISTFFMVTCLCKRLYLTVSYEYYAGCTKAPKPHQSETRSRSVTKMRALHVRVPWQRVPAVDSFIPSSFERGHSEWVTANNLTKQRPNN